MSIRSKLPTPALVLATVAVVLSISGTALAAATAPANSVNSRSIQNSSVRSVDIANGGVKAMDLRTDSVTANAVGTDAIGADELGTTVIVTTLSPATSDTDGTPNGGTSGLASATAQCPAGSQLLGGGARWTSNSAAGTDDGQVYLQESHPENNGTAWTAEGIVDFGAQGNIRLRAEAICLTMQPAT